MTYEQVVEEISNRKRFGLASGRQVTAELMDRLGHPENGMKIIHIAGTNGKGSVAAFISSILREAALESSVGTFTSPHLLDFAERIVVDGKKIPHEDVARIGEMLLSLETTLEPTIFDYTLAIAMIYFRECGVRYLVLETGLGGSQDSTSGLSAIPEVSVITSIGLDHTQFLGDTFEEIAAEKAGILKKGTKLVVGDLPKEARAVIENAAIEQGIEIYTAKPVDDDRQLGLFGSYQRYNAGVAELAVKLFSENISKGTIDLGLKKAKWIGRMDIVSQSPFVLLDGAHNPQGVRALAQSLKEAYSGEKFTFIMAVMADKDYMSMVEEVSSISERIFTCTADTTRAMQAKQLALAVKGAGLNCESFDSFEVALNMAKGYNEKVIIFGSLYFIGEIYEIFM